MMKRTHLILLLIAYGCMAAAKPNIIWIISDDIGDVAHAAYGSDYNVTPNMDAIGSAGFRFTAFNANLSCSPSRVSLLSGRSIGTIGDSDLGTNEVAITTIAKNTGYSTGVFGKWTDPAGFDDFADRDASLAYHNVDKSVYIADGSAIATSETNTDFRAYNLYTNATAWMASQVSSNTPFFMVFADYDLGHSVYQPTPLNYATFAGLSDTNKFFGEVEYLDFIVSNLVADVDALGIASNTVIMFMGDNGQVGPDIPVNGIPIANTGKSTNVVETTFRVPFYIKWPGTIAAGQIYDGITHITDVTATTAEIMDATMPVDRLIDGRSFLQNVLGNRNSPHRQFDYQDYPDGANVYLPYIRTSTHKLVYESGAFKLFSLENYPFSEGLITTKSPTDNAQEAMLRVGFANSTNLTAETMNAWGGHTNERVFLTTP